MSTHPGVDLDREEGEAHESRLGRMIDEFREAQARRLAKEKEGSADARDESTRTATVTGTIHPK